jgi:hypothetical protein
MRTHDTTSAWSVELDEERTEVILRTTSYAPPEPVGSKWNEVFVALGEALGDPEGEALGATVGEVTGVSSPTTLGASCDSSRMRRRHPIAKRGSSRSALSACPPWRWLIVLVIIPVTPPRFGLGRCWGGRIHGVWHGRRATRTPGRVPSHPGRRAREDERRHVGAASSREEGATTPEAAERRRHASAG